MRSSSPPVTSPEGRAVSQTNSVRTRASQAQQSEHIPSREELMKKNEDVMNSVKQAHDYLEEQRYIPKDTQGNRTSLVHMLLLLAHCALCGMLLRGIRAVTTILENEAATKAADVVATNIGKRIDL